jgi:hypothetical protein
LERQQILTLFGWATRFEEDESDKDSEAAEDDWRRPRRRTERNFREQFVSIGYFEATRGYVIYSPRRASQRCLKITYLFYTLRCRVNVSE